MPSQRRKLAGLFCYLVMLAAGPGAAASELLAPLPHDFAHGVRLEGALVVRDLRAYQHWSQHTRDLLREVRAGRALFDLNNKESLLGFDMLREVSKLIALAAPSGAPVPFALAVYSRASELGVQAMVRVEDGFVARLQKASGDSDPPGFSATGDASAMSLSLGGERFAAKIGEDHWLRIAADMPLLIEAGSTSPLFEAAMGRTVSASDSALFVVGGGILHDRLVGLMTSPIARAIAQNSRAVALTWDTDGDKTSALRLVVDAPGLEPFAKALDTRAIADRLTRHLDGDAVSFVSLALPRALLDAIVPWIATRLSAPPYDVPTGVLVGLRGLDGRIGAIAYDSPGDWALAAEMARPQDVEAFIASLQAWAKTFAPADGPGMHESFALETFPGSSTPVIHVRPDPSLEGPYVAGVGNTLYFVQQRSRLRALIDGSQRAPAAGGLLDGPITASMRETLAKDHMLKSYMVLGSDGAWLDYLVWGAGRLQLAAARDPESTPRLQSVLSRVPRYLALGSYLWLRTYDVAASADLTGSLFTFQLNSSEL